MAITDRDQPTYFVCRLKRICLWYQPLAYVSNTQAIRASKLIYNIDLGLTKEYDPIEDFIDSDNLQDPGDNSWIKPTPDKVYLISREVIDQGLQYRQK